MFIKKVKINHNSVLILWLACRNDIWCLETNRKIKNELVGVNITCIKHKR